MLWAALRRAAKLFALGVVTQSGTDFPTLDLQVCQEPLLPHGGGRVVSFGGGGRGHEDTRVCGIGIDVPS